MKTSDTARKIVVFYSLVMQRQLTSVAFDARTATVPPALQNETDLMFQYGLPEALTIPIPDLEITEEGIRATLSIDRTPHKTFVPWTAVFAIFGADGMGVAWNDPPSNEDEEPASPPGNVISLFGRNRP